MQYIGCFEIENNNILICDPLATEIANYIYKVRTLNVLRLRVDQVVNGLWYGYHLYNKEKTYPVGLLIFHKDYDASMLTYEEILEKWRYDGKVCISFGHMALAMDNVYFDNQDYSYTMIEENVVYRIKELLEVCEKEMPPGKNKKKLIALLNERLNEDNRYIECAEFIDLLDNYVPNITDSNLWSIDCYNRCSNPDMPAGTLKGGIVSRASLDFCKVYTHPEMNAIYITLDEELPLFNDKTNNISESLPRFRVL